MKISTQKAIGIFSASLLTTATAVYIYSPVIGTHADSSATADVNLSISEVMSLTLDKNALDLSANLYSFASGTVTATASTNSQYGYTLTLEDVDNNTNLVHTNENIDAVVTSNFEGTKTSATMDNNTWGYSLDATDFSKIPVNGSATTIKTTNVPMTTASETTDVTFGAKVGNLTSGTYTDEVLFTMYTNGQDSPATMQSFSCSDLPNVSDSMVLTDTRDGNEYTVKKLADGKCWMTENLRIVNKTITSEDSDVASEFTIPASNEFGFLDQNNVNNAYIDETYGGFYTWYTATAGEGTNAVTTGTVEHSICPKGWRLPTGGEGGEYETLSSFYTTSAAMRDVPGFTLAGGIYPYVDNPHHAQEYQGYYWASNAQNGYSAYSFVLGDSDLYPNTGYAKLLGGSMRCVAR